MTAKELVIHCKLLEQLLANSQRLIASSTGQARLGFEARAASVRWELEELCSDLPHRSRKPAA